MKLSIYGTAVVCLAWALSLTGCDQRAESNENGTGAPPPVQVEREDDSGVFQVHRVEDFPLVRAENHACLPELSVTGVVGADVSRTVPVVSLSSGRVIDIRARLGDTVEQGQLLLKIQSSDISSAYSEYRQAVADYSLARTQLERARLLYEKGATARKDLEVAVDVENKSQVTLEATMEKLRVLGVTNLDQPPSGIVEIFAPISGVVTEQNVAGGAGVKPLDNSPNLFTIANLDFVWIVCDVYENDLSFVRIGEHADVRLNAYPGRLFKGKISNIGPILDPNSRTAKVRLEMKNPGLMRLGMFVTATFYGPMQETHAVVPASAILHLHDCDWVYVPAGEGKFRRVEVKSGKMLPDKKQAVTGIAPGQPVVANALVLQYTTQQ